VLRVLERTALTCSRRKHWAAVIVHFLLQVFRPRTSPEAMDLVGQLLEYTPTRRVAPLDACVHPYFDELRQPATRLPNGRPLPPMFNFSAAGKFLFSSSNNVYSLMLKILSVTVCRYSLIMCI